VRSGAVADLGTVKTTDDDQHSIARHVSAA
jgi:hypothetical protein